jgi:hypothetical protein
MEYRVNWGIEITADDPHEAAAIALDILRDPESLATVFSVIEASAPVPPVQAGTVVIDLLNEREGE